MSWNKPLPQPTHLSQPYWDGLKAHQVRLQRCDDCGHWIFFPRAHCPSCGGRRLSWTSVSGQGEVYSFTVARVPTLAEFTDEMPQILAVVALDEGPHLNTTLVGCAPEAVTVGARVRPVFDERPGVATLLRHALQDSPGPSVLRLAEAEAGAPTAAQEALPPPSPPKRRISCKDLEAMRALVSDSFGGWSNDFLVSQAVIDEFARLSGDDYWIHTDPQRCRTHSPFGTTIAQGSLVQVLISQLRLPMDHEVVDFTNMVNVGSDRLRFPTPVPAGCRIHARMRISRVEPVKRGVQVTMEINVHVVGQDKPSVINELVILYM